METVKKGGVMHKVINVSIAGVRFMIDLDAHKLLTDYIAALTRKFGDSTENELVQDIEGRIAELLSQWRQSEERVITAEAVKMVIAQIGTVSSIERDSLDTVSGVRYNFGTKEKSASREWISEPSCNPIGSVIGGIFKVFIWILIVLGVIQLLGALTCLVVWCWSWGTFIFPFIPEASFSLGLFFSGAWILLSTAWILLLSRVLTNRPWNKWIVILSLFVASLIGLGLGISKAFATAVEYKGYAEVVEEITVPVASGCLYVIERNDNQYYDSDVAFQLLDTSEKTLIFPASIRVGASETGICTLRITKKSNGRNSEDARRRISDIRYNYQQVGDTLYVDQYFSVSKSDGLRNPRVKVRIEAPDYFHDDR